MFTIVKVRRGLARDDYNDPGWYRAAARHAGPRVDRRAARTHARRDSLAHAIASGAKRSSMSRRGAIMATDWKAVALSACLGIAGLAHAHGDGQPKVQAVKAEQTPFGIAGDRSKATRTVSVNMTDQMRFIPSTLAVKRGETVRFVVANKGATLHEMVLGTPAELAQHAALMKKFPEMEHDAPSMAHVKPGDYGRDRVALQSCRNVSIRVPHSRAFRRGNGRHHHRQVRGEAMYCHLLLAAMLVFVPVVAHATSHDMTKLLPSPAKCARSTRRPASSRLSTRPIPNLDMPDMTMVFRVKDPGDARQSEGR